MRFFDKLTSREEQILALVSKGYKNKQIASELNISVCTVHNHIQSLLRTLEVSTRIEAARLYWSKLPPND
jgi:two-component system nitrate/nitrite response regulator NarP